jgi:hypothetical protein
MCSRSFEYAASYPPKPLYKAEILNYTEIGRGIPLPDYGKMTLRTEPHVVKVEVGEEKPVCCGRHPHGPSRVDVCEVLTVAGLYLDMATRCWETWNQGPALCELQDPPAVVD